MRRNIIFITGGTRSGKSFFALKVADQPHLAKAYIATAQPHDDEMKKRIERHKKERGDDWHTMEEPLDIAKALEELKEYPVILIDCLTLWISNLILNNLDIEKEIDRFLKAIKSLTPGLPSSALIVVSNEVGMGIVPENELARRFRDLAGMLNQRVAEIADEVYLMVSGIPVKIKG